MDLKVAYHCSNWGTKFHSTHNHSFIYRNLYQYHLQTYICAEKKEYMSIGRYEYELKGMEIDVYVYKLIELIMIKFYGDFTIDFYR